MMIQILIKAVPQGPERSVWINPRWVVSVAPNPLGNGETLLWLVGQQDPYRLQETVELLVKRIERELKASVSP